MAVDERSRRKLYDRLEEVLGVGQGDVLMEYLPPVGWADVATRRDVEEAAAVARRNIEATAAAARRDVAGLEQRMTQRFDRLDADLTRRFAGIDARFDRMDDRFDRIDDRFAGLDDRFARQTAEITAAFRGEIIAATTLQTRQTIFAMIGVLLAVAALVAAVLGLG
jgi:hypothetical protein